MTEQFDPRYGIPPRRSEDPAAKRYSRLVFEQQRKRNAEIPVRPSNISWFEKILMEEAGEGDARSPIGYFCNMVPQELILAMGAKPVRLGCGNPALVQPGDEVFSGEICPVAKASFASFLDEKSLASRCDLLIVPTSCDAKKKLGEVLADFAPTFVLNLPPEQDANRYGASMASELERMTRFISKQLGLKLKRRALLKEIEAAQTRTAIVRSLQDARSEKPAALSIRDLYVILQASFAGVPLVDWNREADKVLQEVNSYQVDRKRMRPRLVLTGAPIIWPNFKLLNLIEECGADVVADTLCTGIQSCFDPVVIDEKSKSAIYRALAQRYIFASPCPCFISQATRLSRILDLVKEHRADGVLHYGLRLCQLFDMEVYRLGAIMRQKKIPFTTIRTDYSLEDTEQLRVRLEAFLETVWEEL
ncbi:MAG: 2-hydroxyacyl-CoA dehydratase [Planctomycetes bacterium]|nr:2-hydroxyacyl-CoA dehydratase [Planctomycetota bacterium]